MIIIIGQRKKRLAVILFLYCLLIAGAMRAGAASVNVVSAAKTASGGSWKVTAQGRKYQYKNGNYAQKTWRKIGGHLYRFGADGYCKTGWFTWKGSYYYANSKGKIVISKWKARKGKYYYLQKDARMAVSKMLKLGGKFYYVDNTGARLTSKWLVRKGKRYYFDKNGVALQSKWLKKNGKYYYLGADGVLLVNQWVGEYYVGGDGYRLTNCTVDGYHLGSDGKRDGTGQTGGEGTHTPGDSNESAGSGYIFLGDSRMVGMSSTVSRSNLKYIAKVAMGYNWLQATAGPELKKYLAKNPKVKVVLALGVNDLGNIQNYISYYQALIRDYPNTVFYVLAVNPVDEKKEAAHGYSVKNSAIKDFNRKLSASFGDRYIPSYGYLKKNGFETSDGIHYTASTYQKLYNYIIASAA